jgi:crotonobetainyl-CoA:carnitine CoA-transferase CaiB-like acyl-CoA transferase
MSPADSVSVMASDAAWARSGAMFLTGRPGRPPLLPPPGFVERLWAVGDRLAAGSGRLGRRIGVDVLALLGERAAIAGLHRGGDISCGGAARLLPTADGWLAVNLPRPDDVDLLPAWLPERITHRNGGLSAEAPPARVGPDLAGWSAIADAVAMGSAETLAERAQLLGLAVSALPRCAGRGPSTGLPVTETACGEAAPVRALGGLLVLDLSSLWAGPLCTHLLQLAGARVVKVESRQRPDGARNGRQAFFDLLHSGQESVAVDFGDADGRVALRGLIAAADVVVEASRPRALEQLGVFAEAVLGMAGDAGAGPKVWLSITGYGRHAPDRERVAFGDDAAVAGGLVARDGTGPCFLADAVADPCAGIVSAAAVLEALTTGRRWLLDVSLRGVAAHLAASDTGNTAGSGAAGQPVGVVSEPPRARTPSGRGPRLGEHTEAVLNELRSR